MTPTADEVARFAADLDALIAPEAAIGLAVSGGPDSVALLLLAAAARPGRVQAATVDHALRPESGSEAEYVRHLCSKLGVLHEMLSIDWDERPATRIQERARAERYRLLGDWVERQGLGALLTGHHLDDQAETVLMRLSRGAGLKGLAAMRGSAPVPGHPALRLLRPLLGWRRSRLEQVCLEAGVAPIRDASNDDERFERVRFRKALARSEWLDSDAIARTAAYLGQADDAIEWAAQQAWDSGATVTGAKIVLAPDGVPTELLRRNVRRAVLALASEGEAELRGRELDELMNALGSRRAATLRGVLCTGGERWCFVPAPNRTRRSPPRG